MIFALTEYDLNFDLGVCE